MSPEAQARWVREGLLEGLLVAWAKSLIDAESDLIAVWDSALEERLVSGSPEGLVRAFVRQKAGVVNRAKAKGLKDLLAYLKKAHLETLVKISGAFDEQFLNAANAITAEAMRELWPAEAYVERIKQVADLFGAQGFKSAHAATWYRTYVLNLGYNQAQIELLRDTPAGRLFPYIRFRTRRDALVRDEHARLEGMTAVSDWPLWGLFRPPLGWNCRCWLEKISWLSARARGLVGDIAMGVSAAEEFLAAGGGRF